MVDFLLWLLSLLTGFLLTGAVVILFLRVRRKKTIKVLEKRVLDEGDSIRLPATGARYSGADFGYSQGKNNGVLVLSDRALCYQHFLEKVPSIVLPLADIRQVTVETSFPGDMQPIVGHGFLVIHTGDNNRIGFLLKTPEILRDAIQPK